MKVMIAAGGTGGHLYPAIALAGELLRRKCGVLFLTGKHSRAREALGQAGLEFSAVSCAPWSGQNPVRVLTGFAQNAAGVLQARSRILSYDPDRVVGFGSYVSVPGVVAAAWLGVPVVIHEQNVIPGWANRFCARFAGAICISYEDSRAYFSRRKDCLWTGNPVRSGLFRLDREQALKNLGLRSDRLTLLAFGGSGGARSLNAALGQAAESMLELKNRVQFLHLTGHPDPTALLRSAYGRLGFHAQVLDYSHRMDFAYAAADLVVARSGATTVSELAATRKPAILVPYPYATDRHQEKNARLLQDKGCAIMLLESSHLADDLSVQIRALASDPERLKAMQNGYAGLNPSLSEAAGRLADAVLAPQP